MHLIQAAADLGVDAVAPVAGAAVLQPEDDGPGIAGVALRQLEQALLPPQRRLRLGALHRVGKVGMLVHPPVERLVIHIDLAGEGIQAVAVLEAVDDRLAIVGPIPGRQGTGHGLDGLREVGMGVGPLVDGLEHHADMAREFGDGVKVRHRLAIGRTIQRRPPTGHRSPRLFRIGVKLVFATAHATASTKNREPVKAAASSRASRLR